MKERLAELIVCPVDGTALELRVWESHRVELSDDDRDRAGRISVDPGLLSHEIVTGVLLNRARKILYPIHAGVPRMLTYPTGVAREFLRRHQSRLRQDLPGFHAPDREPPTGEETVLRTFSSEWVNYDWDGKTYWNIDPERMFASMRFMLDLEHHPIRDRLVLEVGIGIGGIADYMASHEGAEMIGVDLGYAVDAAYRNFGRNRFLHIVQASAFAPPFAPSTFDFVYSQGVIHHTSSTITAFGQLARLPKINGRLYIWVYSPTSEDRSFLRRSLMKMENALRPLIWPLPESLQRIALLPIVPLYLIHQNLLVRRREDHYIRYGWREALHAARDRFTPRYAFRHSESEVCRWCREAGYSDIQVASGRERPETVPPGFTIATAVDGVRTDETK